jgi:hypothetical protein
MNEYKIISILFSFFCYCAHSQHTRSKFNLSNIKKGIIKPERENKGRGRTTKLCNLFIFINKKS